MIKKYTVILNVSTPASAHEFKVKFTNSQLKILKWKILKKYLFFVLTLFCIKK